MRRFGCSQAQIETVRVKLLGGPETGSGVWPQNVAIVDAFLAASSQWRVAPIGGGTVPARLIYVGLDYAGARVGIEACGIAITPQLWNGLRVMEAAALAALNEARG